MEKDKDLTSINHSISVIERKNILITGVKKVDSFDKEEFLVETIMGYLALKGEELELVKLDTLAVLKLLIFKDVKLVHPLNIES